MIKLPRSLSLSHVEVEAAVKKYGGFQALESGLIGYSQWGLLYTTWPKRMW